MKKIAHSLSQQTMMKRYPQRLKRLQECLILLTHQKSTMEITGSGFLQRSRSYLRKSAMSLRCFLKNIQSSQTTPASPQFAKFWGALRKR
ncbi:hypothetical protein A8M32_00545 [Sinorhizobium alkalisoli]|uniref:Uncharacterized protein n=1 Tax=Sinorhizobium alkalisoli TaxID=1752398 RepID=A0A1E3VJ29_9HYPH|nr:hypothetical protein A8M32_00545 [Sinorhizobium alkalisoli]